MRTRGLGLVIAVAVLLVAAPSATANHRINGGVHWDKTAIGVFEDGLSGTTWSLGDGNPGGTVIGDWNASVLTVFPESSGHEVHARVASLGLNGILGYAAYSYDRRTKHFVGVVDVVLNESYAPQLTADQERHVYCHELGHALGLGHIKKPSAQGCMNDLMFVPVPDQHDYDQLAALYSHSHAGGPGIPSDIRRGRITVPAPF